MAGLIWTLAAHAETLDRIAVTIDRHVISERDVLNEIRIAAFLDGRMPDFSGEQKRKAADRLVDQYLVLQDAEGTRASLASPEDAAPLLESIRARYKSQAEFSAALAEAGITEAELSAQLLAGLRMLRYTDLRFRPEVQLAEETLRAYYDRLQSEGGSKATAGRSYEASRDQIEKLLTDQEVMQSLDRWLAARRGESRIVYRDEVFEDAGSVGGISSHKATREAALP